MKHVLSATAFVSLTSVSRASVLLCNTDDRYKPRDQKSESHQEWGRFPGVALLRLCGLMFLWCYMAQYYGTRDGALSPMSHVSPISLPTNKGDNPSADQGSQQNYHRACPMQ